MSNYSHLIFDFDGTLFNSAKGIKNGFKYALKHFGITENNEARLESFIGPPLADSFGKTYGFKGDELLEIIRVFRVYYSDKGVMESEIYPGIKAMLTNLQKANKTLAIATAKPTHYALQILEANQLSACFMPVCGSPKTGNLHAKHITINQVLHHHKPPINKTIMVGDTVYDMQGAQHHKLDTTAVNYGYGLKADLLACKPTYFVETVKELSEILLG